ncbi:golgin subfamily A member 6-like protein 22 isoform X2 [Varroa destructor]|nr:golgin subfamily A member 6-like protein 22 isoform X2 [Varroa destructor]
MILMKQILKLLSKRSAQFTLMDIIKPDTKKFEKMVQQMLMYLYHSDRVFEIVEQVCLDLDEKGAQVQRERETLDCERNELNVAVQRLKVLEELRVAEALAETSERKEKMDKESGVAKIAYEKLKEQVKDAANEIDGLKAELERRLERLTDLRASIVEDPDTCVAKLHELREEVSLHKEQVESKEHALFEATEHLQLLQDALERSKAIHKQALMAASAHEELAQSEKERERSTAAQARTLLELESQLGELKALVEARKHQFEKIQEEDREVRESLLALEETEQQLKEQREKAETRRRHLLNETTKVAGIIENVQRTTVTMKKNVMCQLIEGHGEQMKIWKDHVNAMADFSKACRIADDQIEARHAQLTALSETIERVASTGTTHN